LVSSAALNASIDHCSVDHLLTREDG
jgi:hypothetical protein